MKKTKLHRYESEEIVVTFDKARCIHAAECVRGLPTVFDVGRRPWVDPSQEPAEKVAEAVRRCPTGALGYEAPAESAAAENTVEVVPDGPLYLRGRIVVHGADGEVVEETRVALCRCGDSANKPFCDNTHVEAGFVDAGEIEEHKLTAGEGAAVGAPLEVRLAPNGPVLLSGRFRVVAPSGSGDGVKAALCRCGASATKPYCDGAHGAAGFVAD